MSDTLEARLQLIEDRQAIHDVIVRYCRGVDRNDAALVEAAFHPDAIDNHNGPILPYYEAIGTLKSARNPNAPPSKTTSMHNLSNILIELDGDIARCESYVNVVVRIPQDGGGAIDWLHAGRYVDRFERRNGEWRIAYRTVVYDIERFDEVVPAPAGLSQARYLDVAVRGRKGKGDFSYEILNPA